MNNNDLFYQPVSTTQPSNSTSALPAHLFDPEYLSKVDVDFSNVALITRKLVDVNPKTQLAGLVCFCRDAQGKQLPALKKTSRTFLCGNANSKTAPKCGFRIGAQTLTYLHKYNILKNASEVVFPICKTCSFSWLMHSTNEKIKDQLGNITFICNCDPYSAKINIPISDPAVSAAFDLNAYNYAVKDVRSSCASSKDVMGDLLAASAPATSKHYIPE